jgi:hypothetical protein
MEKFSTGEFHDSPRRRAVTEYITLQTAGL